MNCAFDQHLGQYNSIKRLGLDGVQNNEDGGDHAADQDRRSHRDDRSDVGSEAFGAQAGAEAQVTATPFVLSGVSGRIPRVTVRRTDADIPGPGVGTASVEMFNLELETPKDALHGEIVGANARLVRRRIRLDGVGFGELLGITDLDIACLLYTSRAHET